MERNINLVYFHSEGLSFDKVSDSISVKSINLIDFILHVSFYVNSVTIVSPSIYISDSFDLALPSNVNIVQVPIIRKSPLAVIDLLKNYLKIKSLLLSFQYPPRTLSIGLSFFGTFTSIICYKLFSKHNFIVRGDRLSTFFKSSRSIVMKLSGIRLYVYKFIMLFLVRNKCHIFFQGDSYIKKLQKMLPLNCSERLFVLNALVSDCDLPSRSQDKKFDLIFVGHINQEKGVFDLVDAIEYLNSNNISISCLIIGGGSDTIRLERSISDIPNITYLGLCTDRNLLYEHIISSRFLILPSYTEGMPRVLLEAMVLGVPIIATKVGGIPNIIVDDFSGYLLESHQYKHIAGKIKSLLRSDCSHQHLFVAKNAKLITSSFLFSSRASFLINNLS